VEIPAFEYIDSRGETPGFVGYRQVTGEPLTTECFASLKLPAQERTLATLAAFLQAVHSFPLAVATACGVEERSVAAWVRTSWSDSRAAMLTVLAPDEGQALDSLIASFLADERSLTYAPCLLYADFAPEHILFDQATSTVTGIIDWGDLAIGDPDFDLLYLFQDYGRQFVDRLLNYLPHPEPGRLMRKLRVFTASDYAATIASAATVESKVTAEDQIAECVAALREILRSTEQQNG
jgi:aminoglycoside 2''-phosphotransferase